MLPDEPLCSGEVVLPVEALEPVVDDESPVPEVLLPVVLPVPPDEDELGSEALLPEPVVPEPDAPPLVLPDVLLSLLPPVEPLPAEPLSPDVPPAAGLALELEPEPGVEPEDPGVLPVLPVLPAAPPADDPPSVALGADVGDVGDAPAVVPVSPAAPPALPVDPAAPLLGVLPAAPAVLLSAGDVVVDGVLALGSGVLGVLAVLLGVDVEPPAPPAAPALGLPPDSEPSRLHPANANPINAVTRTTLEVLTIAFMELPFTWSRSRLRRLHHLRRLHRKNPCCPNRPSFGSCQVCHHRSMRRIGHLRRVDHNQQRPGSTLQLLPEL